MGIRSRIKAFINFLLGRKPHDYLASNSHRDNPKNLQTARQPSEVVMPNYQHELVAPKRVSKKALQLQHLEVYIEKSEGMGEDAQPILEVQDNKGILAVFDGLGGSGSTTYTDTNGKMRSGAYLAARMAQRVMLERWQEFDVSAESITPFLDDLEANLQKNFQKLASKLSPASMAILKGSTLKKFPTTIASIIYSRLHAADLVALENPPGIKSGAYQIACAWAGDSRCYMLHPTDGLQQLTKDDTVFESDAYSSLYNDPPISKTINAEDRVTLNRELFYLTSPSIILVCSDGCYNYLETPMHFEQILLSSLVTAKDIIEWQNALTIALGKVAGDDVSLALVAIGWKDFLSMRKDFETRFKHVDNIYFDPLEKIRLSIQDLENRLETARKQQDELKSSLWKEYKQNYMQFSG